DLDFGALEVELEQGGEELAASHQQGELLKVDGDGLRILSPAVDDCGDATLAADGAGAPLAGVCAQGSLELACLLGRWWASPHKKRDPSAKLRAPGGGGL